MSDLYNIVQILKLIIIFVPINKLAKRSVSNRWPFFIYSFALYLAKEASEGYNTKK